jgi:glycosyltransferase involved in cell wall biosynthesis
MRALISTIRPACGGVAAKLEWVIAELEALGITPVLAWYEPWSCRPELSVPFGALLQGRQPGQHQEASLGGHLGHGLGAWLPELEFTHFQPRDYWKTLVASCDLHLAVTGNPLCAARYSSLNVPFLAWIGSDWQGDRRDRVRQFPPARRLLDRSVNGPVLRRLERQVLRAPKGHILTISEVTGRALAAIGGRPMDGVLYRPSDPQLFFPAPERRVPWRLGFSGRYSDPRKQIDLLLAVVQRLVRQGRPVQLELTGEADGSFLLPRLQALGIADRVHCHPLLPAAQLAATLQSWDLFVIPSHQEGLCIAALEAMACGIPVVSTRCGGPEDFVISGQTGALVEGAPAAMAASVVGAMAEAITAICAQPQRRQRLGLGAAAWIDRHASPLVARRRFRHHLRATFPALP